MALVVNPPLQLSGKLEGVVFRRMNGKIFLAARPQKYKKSMTKEAVTARKNFKITSFLAKEIAAVEELKEIWKNSPEAPANNTFNRIMKSNIKLTEKGKLTAANIITPAGLKMKINSIHIVDKKLHFNFSLPKSKTIKLPGLLFIFFYFTPNTILSHIEQVEKTEEPKAHKMEINLPYRIKKKLDTKCNPIIYLAYSNTTAGKRKYWTNTYAEQLH